MVAVVAKVYKKKNQFVGEPKQDDFELVEEELPAINNGEFLLQAEFLSVDPYMRVFPVPSGVTMIGGQVGKVIESKSSEFPVGSYVFAEVGWRSHTVINPNHAEFNDNNRPYVLPNFGTLSRSLGLGVCGMPGNTAYFGFLEICEPKEGEVLVVSGAAGAVGSIVGQIGKIKGMTVIGIAGSDDKCAWLKSIGFDYAINYKNQDVSAELSKAAPKGVDCYFDNVGGELAGIVIHQMREYGRISVCGAISGYNEEKTVLVPILQPKFVFTQVSMEGFMVKRWWNRWIEGIDQMLKWVGEGKIKAEETITDGFENMPTAFIKMLQGSNTGKAVVKV